jgi:hypothetical protein
MLKAEFTRKELRILELTQAWPNGLSRAKARARRLPATCDKAILNAPITPNAGFAGSVAVQARQSPEETRWLLELGNDVRTGTNLKPEAAGPASTKNAASHIRRGCKSRNAGEHQCAWCAFMNK